MKIRTIDQLLQKIAEDRVWRIREISALRAQCNDAILPAYYLSALRRSFVPIAYAHWEGFVKKTSNYYLEFVACQHLTLSELSSPFISMYLMQKCSKSLALGKSFSLKEVCDRLDTEGDHQIRIQFKEVISTNSNLDSKTLQNICATLGISYQDFESKEVFINSQLVGKRNHIAHGEAQEIEKDELDQIKNTVIELIDNFRNEVENNAVMGGYKKSN